MSKNNLTTQEIMDYTVEIASAYLSNNEVSFDDLSMLLKKAFTAVAEISSDTNNLNLCRNLVPAAPIEKSVQNDYIIYLEDGKKLQMLKRHLSTVYGMTVEEYREKWGLLADYPVVSPNYARRRSAIAKTTGLGSTGRKPQKAA